MSESKLVPNIRFKGFFDEWKRIKFLNCLTKIIDYRGRTPKKLGLKWCDDGEYRALSALNVKNGYIDKNNDVHFGDFDLYKKWMGKAELKKGDILFTTEAPMGNVAIISDNEKYILSQRTIAFRVDQKLFNNLFLSYILRTTTVNNKLKSLSTGGTAQGVSQKSLSYLALRVTNNVDEQQKIGGLFAKLDRLLDLQQQKLDQLELLKKVLLQKLFPKQDAKIPDLRFKGFEEEWKKDAIGDLIKSVGYKNYLADASSLGEYPVIQQGEEPVLGYSSKKPFQKYNDVVLFGDHTLSLYKPKSPFLIATDGIKIVFVKNWNGQFLYAFLQKYKPHSEGYKRHFTILKSKVGKYPLDIKEQQKIGNLLAKIDRLIELENKKFSNLKLVKKSLLQNMFVE